MRTDESDAADAFDDGGVAVVAAAVESAAGVQQCQAIAGDSLTGQKILVESRSLVDLAVPGRGEDKFVADTNGGTRKRDKTNLESKGEVELEDDVVADDDFESCIRNLRRSPTRRIVPGCQPDFQT